MWGQSSAEIAAWFECKQTYLHSKLDSNSNSNAMVVMADDTLEILDG